MSPQADDAAEALPHPRATSVLFGHSEVEAALLAAYRSGRVPHAWLIACIVAAVGVLVFYLRAPLLAFLW